ncbi:hypothetical protein B296_00001944 [Ensete ventricosum]|uniref:Uncharacterized protein n=1 Tax=Ensete ventricosum TaxID=4639 RepID=A0A426YVT6_ENSVE|nr:hypothetical protein B296_00001944 [Ensete ventricosum]
MTSLGLFEAKLEAVETHMDAKLCAIFMEFKLDRSQSPRRSQHGVNSDCKKNPSEIRSEDKTRQPYTSMTSISFCSLISGYFHDFTKEWTMMLKVFPDDDLRPMAHDRKKE